MVITHACSSLRRLFHLPPPAPRPPPADANIDLIEDQGSRQNRLLLSSRTTRGSFFHRHLQRQHHAGHLATGRNLMQWLQRLPRIGGDQAFHLVPTISRPALASLLRRYLNMKPRTHAKIIDLRLSQLLKPLRRIHTARRELRCSESIRRRILLLL